VLYVDDVNLLTMDDEVEDALQRSGMKRNAARSHGQKYLTIAVALSKGKSAMVISLPMSGRMTVRGITQPRLITICKSSSQMALMKA
jgi:hypothetical protein